MNCCKSNDLVPCVQWKLGSTWVSSKTDQSLLSQYNTHYYLSNLIWLVGSRLVAASWTTGSGRSWRSHSTWADPSDQVTKVIMFLLYTYIKLTTTNWILTMISSRNGKIDAVWRDVATSCQTTSPQNFVDVTISKHVMEEQENVFIVFNFVSLV